MDDIGESVADLTVGEGPTRPVGEPRGFVERGLGELADQRLIACRIAEAANHGGYLSVEERFRNRSGQVEKDLDILPRRVEHLESALIRHQIEERRQIDPGGERIDRRRIFGARNLHQA